MGSKVGEFNDIKGVRLFALLLLLGSIIVPGAGYLYVTQPAYFNSLDVGHLLILSAIISAPALVLSIVLFRKFPLSKTSFAEENDAVLQAIIEASYTTLMSFFVLMFADIPRELGGSRHLDEHTFLIFYYAGIVLTWCVAWWLNNKRQKHSSTSERVPKSRVQKPKTEGYWNQVFRWRTWIRASLISCGIGVSAILGSWLRLDSWWWVFPWLGLAILALVLIPQKIIDVLFP